MPDQPILFISDLHLEQERPDISQAFENFLASKAAHAQALYILGDFFNVWLGDDLDRDPASRVAESLNTLSRQGLAIYLMHGNRDFLIGERFAGACGARLISEPYLLKAFDHKVLLMHGDVLCTDDTDYMAFRRQVRDPDWQASFLAMPAEARIEFAAKARETSKAMNSNKAEDIMDVTASAVEQVMQDHAVNELIHGHTHRPAVHSLQINGKEARRYVLGDWDKNPRYVQLDETGLNLETFQG